jgi:predicted acetyltransferase
MTSARDAALEIRRATPADRPALQRMLELYQYELSDIWDQDLDADGCYGYSLDRYWQDAACTPFVACVGEHYAGFALVDQAVKVGDRGHWMDQFFVLKKYRRTGLGRQLATWAFDALPGIWEVGQMRDNSAARAFWRRVIGDYARGRYAEHTLAGGWWEGTVQRFCGGCDVPRPDSDASA